MMPANCTNYSSSTCWFEPAPDVAQPSPGCRFAGSINSATKVTPSVGSASASGWARELNDGHELVEIVGAQFQNMRSTRHVVVGDENRIAIRWTLDRSLDADRSARSGAVLDHNLLTDRARDRFAHHTGHAVQSCAPSRARLYRTRCSISRCCFTGITNTRRRRADNP